MDRFIFLSGMAAGEIDFQIYSGRRSQWRYCVILNLRVPSFLSGFFVLILRPDSILFELVLQCMHRAV